MPRVQTPDLPRPLEGHFLLCIRCGAALFYVRQDRTRGVTEHHFACRRCGQTHAAWEMWEPGQVSTEVVETP